MLLLEWRSALVPESRTPDFENQYHFLEIIVPLEHPRFVTQYHPKDHDKYLEKYLNALHHESC